MAKGLGGFLTAVVAIGAAAAGINYYMKYKKAQEELDRELKEFDDDCPAEVREDSLYDNSDTSEEDIVEEDIIEEDIDKEDIDKTFEDDDRKYISLNANKSQFIDAAKATWNEAKGFAQPARATWEKAKDMAEPVKGLASDAAKIVAEKISGAGSAAAGKFDDLKNDAYVVLGDARNAAEKSFAEAKDTVYVAKEKAMNRFYELREQGAGFASADEPEEKPETTISEEE